MSTDPFSRGPPAGGTRLHPGAFTPGSSRVGLAIGPATVLATGSGRRAGGTHPPRGSATLSFAECASRLRTCPVGFFTTPGSSQRAARRFDAVGRAVVLVEVSRRDAFSTRAILERVTDPHAADETRIDRWLCAVRLVKTRPLATRLCEGGHVLVNGLPAKPSTKVRAGDRVEALIADRERIVEVVRPIESRVGAPVAATCYVDHSPPRRAGGRAGDHGRAWGGPAEQASPARARAPAPGCRRLSPRKTGHGQRQPAVSSPLAMARSGSAAATLLELPSALRELVHQLVEVPDPLHERVLDRFDAHPADDARDAGLRWGSGAPLRRSPRRSCRRQGAGPVRTGRTRSASGSPRRARPGCGPSSRPSRGRAGRPRPGSW